MKSLLLPATIFAALCLAPPAARAASSGWETVDGGAIRIVTSGLPDQNGMLQGALEINLKPGWKTYWRDPGDAGVPPLVSVAQPDSSVEIDFPAPDRFDDGYSIWAGYKHPVALPLTFRLGEATSSLEVSVFLGICEVICIPVQADYRIIFDDSPQAVSDKAIVDNAFAALPSPAREGFEAMLRSVDNEKLIIDVNVPNGPGKSELFVASTENWSFGTPKPVDGSFEFPVLFSPEDNAATNETVHYTLVTPDQAVSGTFEIKP